MRKSEDKSFVALTTPKTDTPWQDKPNPMGSSNWLGMGLMFWLDPLIRKGAKNTLNEEDVWKLSPSDTAGELHNRFRAFWAMELTSKKPLFVRALVRTLWWETLFATGIFLLYSALMMLQPTVIQALMQYIMGNTTNPIGINSGYVLAALLTTLSFVSVTLVDFAQAIVAKSGCNAKTLAMDVVFLKALMLSGFAKKNISSGQVVTLATVDSTRVFDLYIWGPWVIVAPFTIITIFIVIGFTLGLIVGLVGAVLMAMVLTYSFRAAKTVGRLRRELAAVQAERIKLTNEILQGVRVVKLYAWETMLETQLDMIRAREVALLKRFQYNSRLPAATLQVSSVFVFAVCLLIYVAQGYKLTPDIAFATMAYVGVARLPCSLFCNGVINCSESLTSCDRLGSFLLVDEIDEQKRLEAPSVTDDSTTIEISNASYSWETSSSDNQVAEPTLRNISLTVTPGSLTIVVGPVGSGKSSLISAILGEIHRVDGEQHVSGNIAYVSQEPWIQHASLKENVLFYDNLDEYRYDQVLSACQLKSDLAILPNGDATEIGERGINLSGGQKARVSLARAMYRSNANLYLLDDPLSALDVHVAGAVFRECIQKLLRGKTVVLVLNSHYHLLPHADRILVMDNGSIVGDGAFSSIKDAFPHLQHLSSAENSEDRNSEHIQPATAKVEESGSKKSSSLVVKEERSVGAVTLGTYLTFFGSSGWRGSIAASALFVVFVLSQGLLVVADWYLGYWSKNASESLNSAWTYFALAFLAVGFVWGCCAFVLYFCLLCSKSMHATLIDKVIRAPVTTFFDVTPVGRILNRFASDLDQLDNLLPWLGLLQAQYTFQVAAVLLVCGITSPYIVLIYLPLVYLFYKIQLYFNLSSAELKRLDSITKSPVVNLISEILSGISTIRAFGMTYSFQERSRLALNHNQTYFTIHFMASRWLQMRLDWLSAIIITGVSFLVVGSKDTIGITNAGLALTYASQLSSVLSRAVQGYSKLDSIMTCAERLHHYESLDKEGATAEVTIQDSQLESWPSSGAIEFDQFSMKYREDLTLVLKNVSFAVRGGERIGICGRTGSGKSSLMAALFRTVEATSGCIKIDNLDIAGVSLSSLRSRLTIIPQDPVLFSSSLRFNLDPSDSFSDHDLWTVLKQVQLNEAINNTLDFQIAEKGSNLSVGQRQLLCIARALLRSSRIVVLDEATANIDLETDRLIQNTIRSSFQGVTMLTIAHRLDTIMDSDRILVMDNGAVKEYDTPEMLLSQSTSTFAALMKQAHLVQS